MVSSLTTFTNSPDKYSEFTPSEQIAIYVCEGNVFKIENLINEKHADPTIALTRSVIDKINKISKTEFDTRGLTALHIACKFGSEKTIDCLLQFVEKFPKMLHIKNSNGRTPLHILALNRRAFGARKIVKIVKLGGNIFELDNNHQTPLIYIVQRKTFEIMQRIFSKLGPILSLRTIEIFQAIVPNNRFSRGIATSLLGYLNLSDLEKFQNIKENNNRKTLLQAACFAEEEQRFKKVQFLLKKGHDPHELFTVSTDGSYGLGRLLNPSITYELEGGITDEERKLFLKQLREIHKKCKRIHVQTAQLAICALQGNLKKIEHLLEKEKVDPHLLVCGDGMNGAIQEIGKKEGQKVLDQIHSLSEDRGTGWHYMYGNSVFQFACRAGQKGVIQYFIKMYPDIIHHVEIPLYEMVGNSPFYELMLGNCSRELIEIFLKAGANLWEYNRYDNKWLLEELLTNPKSSIPTSTIIDEMRKAKKIDDGEEMLSRDLINEDVVGGKTLLQHFAVKGDIESVKLLLEAGADPYITQVEDIKDEAIIKLLKDKCIEKDRSGKRSSEEYKRDPQS
ncbi:MAG: ankyrin repeat domain-containing protein [Parachlamydiaceae bacterium]|nr:ankyrin repeat domain-containing protein [Parachlamydiaceae bacterium]